MPPLRRLFWGGCVLAGLGYGAAQGVALQRDYERFRREAGPAWVDGGAGWGLGWTGPELVISEPSFIWRLAGQEVSWHAAQLVLHGPPLGGRTVEATAQRIRTARGELPVEAGTLRIVPGAGPVLTAGSASFGTGPGRVEAWGLKVAPGPGTARLEARSVRVGALPGLWGPVAAEVEGGSGMDAAPLRLHILRAEWEGARLGLSGVLGLNTAGRPTFAGTVSLEGYAGALGVLVRDGVLTANAARAVRAVLGLHAAAQPPAPLVVSFDGGVLTVAGFPLWRAE